MYDIATNIVFFVDHVKLLVSVGTGNLERVIHDTTLIANPIKNDIGPATNCGKYGNPDENNEIRPNVLRLEDFFFVFVVVVDDFCFFDVNSCW